MSDLLFYTLLVVNLQFFTSSTRLSSRYCTDALSDQFSAPCFMLLPMGLGMQAPIGHHCTREIRILQVRTHQCRIPQTRSPQIDAAQASTIEVSSP